LVRTVAFEDAPVGGRERTVTREPDRA
jgi:hypothetical protein